MTDAAICPTCLSVDPKRLLHACTVYGALDPWHYAAVCEPVPALRAKEREGRFTCVDCHEPICDHTAERAFQLQQRVSEFKRNFPLVAEQRNQMQQERDRLREALIACDLAIFGTDPNHTLNEAKRLARAALAQGADATAASKPPARTEP